MLVLKAWHDFPRMLLGDKLVQRRTNVRANTAAPGLGAGLANIVFEVMGTHLNNAVVQRMLP